MTLLDKFTEQVVGCAALIALAIPPAIIISFFSYYGRPEIIKSHLINKMGQLVDYDRNGLTTNTEWTRAYDELGFNYRGEQGFDLPMNDIKEFIQRNER